MVQAENSIQLYKDPSATDIAASSIDTDLTKYTRLGWWIVIGGLGSFLLWASFAPLDKGVPLSGTVAVASNKKAIQQAQMPRRCACNTSRHAACKRD
jgi:protease secretion system membrane fusion protein